MLMNRGVRLLPVFVFGLVTALAYSLENVLTGWPGTFVWLVKVPALACFLLSMGEWVAVKSLDSFERSARAKAITPAAYLAERVAGLDSTRLEILRMSLAGEDCVRSEEGFQLLDGVPIPNAFLEEHLKGANGFYLPPVRNYVEGSADRSHAQHLSEFLVRRGAATPAQGNRPVRVNNWQRVYDAIGWGVENVMEKV